MGFLSSHDVSVPPGPPVVVVCRRLEWVVCLLPPQWFLSMLCSTTHVNTMSDNFWPLLHGGQQHPESLDKYTK